MKVETFGAGGMSADGRYERPLIHESPFIKFLYGEKKIEETQFPYPSWDQATWQRRKFWRNRDVKGAWWTDRITGSRKTHGGYSRKDKDRFYNRLKLVDIEKYRHLMVDNCPYCKKLMNYGLGYNKRLFIINFGSELRPSLDRIDGKKGYEPDNVWVICTECNTWKG